MKRYVTLNDAADAVVWRVVEEAGLSVGIVDAELEVRQPDLKQRVQWTDRCYLRVPTRRQLAEFDRRLEKTLDNSSEP